MIILFSFSTHNLFAQSQKEKDYTQFVDPFIGSMGGGNVFVGVCLPNGFVKLGPDNETYSGASGYKKNKDIIGFSHQHVSGMGGPMYGNIQLMPTTGDLEITRHSSAKANEVVTPSSYKADLTTYKTRAELTATAHAGFHRYTFPKSKDAHILIDVGATLYGTTSNWFSSMPTGGDVHIDPQQKVVYGYGTYKGGRSTHLPWRVYFYAVFDTGFDSYGTWNDSIKHDKAREIQGKEIGAYLNFATRQGQAIQVKVGISMISVEQARKNVESEIPAWDFLSAEKDLKSIWNKELSKLDIAGMSEKDNKTFYTAWYHALLMPSDWTGENPVFDSKRPYYEDFLCIWDIYRTVSPLLTLTSTKKHIGMLNTLLDIYKHDGWLPDAHSALQREHIQVGTNADVLFADAFVKGLKGVDYQFAYEAMKKDAEDPSGGLDKDGNKGRPGLDSYKKLNYLAADAQLPGRKLTVSRTLEYTYDDFCISQLAKGLGMNADAQLYEGRALWYKNLWDRSLKLMRGKNLDGTWITPFIPDKPETGPCFYEGHSYTWTYVVPHDVKGLIGLFGGKDIFTDSLNAVMSKHYEAYNEPCMLQAYLYAWSGRPDLTQKYVRAAADKYFNSEADGLPGNDDSGATSAWYVWSRMGIFPVSGQNLYLIGSPSSPSTTIRMESGKNIIINALNASPSNIYVQSLKLNGKSYDKPYFTHDDIKNGAVFDFVMGDQPSHWGSKFAPPSLSGEIKH